jgi:threonine dehydrogenase-like Zn-dependent dehydrogenase
MQTKLLHLTRSGLVEEYDWTMPIMQSNQIKIKTILVGICRSDLGNYMGHESMPYSDENNPDGIIGTWGHEGVGEVIEVGDNITDGIKIGDIVSTFSDPAYSYFYYAKQGEYVKIPYVDSSLILQPLACAVNIYLETIKFADFLGYRDDSILLLGSGFMATVIAKLAKKDNRDIIVVGRANKELYSDLGIKTLEFAKDALYRKWNTIIDISSKSENFYLISNKLGDIGALIAYCGTPESDIKTNFFNNCWNDHHFILPSPRTKTFIDAMALSRDLVLSKELDMTGLWTRGYARDNFHQAFEDGANRNPGYVRGYIDFRR